MPHYPRLKRIREAHELFRWLVDLRYSSGRKHPDNQTAENIACALEWVLKIGTRANGNPIPELLDEIRKLKGEAISGNSPRDKDKTK